VENWNLWLNSNETRKVVKILNETVEELRELVTNGSHIQEKNSDKIALDYTYSLGQLDGMKTMIEMIKDISSIVEEESND
jgi:hypothetical protein